MPGVWSQGINNHRWEKVRREVIARDGGHCRLEIPGVCVGDAGPRHVHHLDGGNSADPYDPERLITTCAKCNWHVGDPTTDEQTDSEMPLWLRNLVRERHADPEDTR